MSVPANPEFFEVTAQVIPVLLLALLIDHRGELEPPAEDEPRPRWSGPEGRLALDRLLMLAALVWAEVAALAAVAGRPTQLQFMVVLFGLFIGAVGAIDGVVVPEIDRLNRSMRRGPRLATIVLVIIAVVAPVAGGVVVALF